MVKYVYMAKSAHISRNSYGHRPPDIGAETLDGSWIRGVRHLASRSAKGSFWHRHDETSIICCLRGEYTYELHGLPPITIAAGSFIVIPAQVEHRHLKAVDPVGDRLEILLAPNPSKPSRHLAYDLATCRALHSELLKRALTPVKCGKELTELCRELHALSGRGPQRLTAPEIGLARLLCQLILYRMARPSASAPRRTTLPFANVASWIEAHLAERIDIDRLVAHIGYSRTQVFTLFRDNTGLTPADFLMRMRVRKAQSLLETTDLSANKVASQCGFSSAATFNAVFRRQTGATPLDWRRHAKQKTLALARTAQAAFRGY